MLSLGKSFNSGKNTAGRFPLSRDFMNRLKNPNVLIKNDPVIFISLQHWIKHLAIFFFGFFGKAENSYCLRKELDHSKYLYPISIFSLLILGFSLYQLGKYIR